MVRSALTHQVAAEIRCLLYSPDGAANRIYYWEARDDMFMLAHRLGRRPNIGATFSTSFMK